MSQQYLTWLQGHLNELHDKPILENFLRLQFTEFSEGRVGCQCELDEQHGNIYGFIHGGTLASVCDVAMGTACLTLGKRIVTIDMNVSYIRNIPTAGVIRAVGTVISNGRTILRATGQIFSTEGQLLVQSQASYFVTGEYTGQEEPKS